MTRLPATALAASLSLLLPLMLADLPPAAAEALAPSPPPPAPIRTYPLDADGGILYTPLSDEARRVGTLPAPGRGERCRGSLQLGRYTLSFDTPKAASGYDLVAIPYRLSWSGEAAFPLAVEATAFEDEARRRGRDLFDLALPGKLSLDVKYLGSITAHMKPGARHNLKPDMTDEPGVYPGFTRRPMVRSGVVETGDILWFRFRVTNTGDTILDPEGFGGWGLYPELCRKDADGQWKHHSYHYNLYIRDRHYLYPGESRDFWVNFHSAESMDSYRIPPGEYLLRFRTYFRTYRGWNDWVNMWEGAWMHNAEMPITVAEKPRQAPVAPLKVTLTDGDQPDKITRYIAKLEEFMTAFDVRQSAPRGARSLKGVLYLQVAPWTRHVVVKLIATDPVRCRTLAVPIAVRNDTLSLKPKLHPGNCMVVDGKRVPVIYSQLMCDMRANIQVSPWPERYIRNDIRRMMECGINVCATTAMPWLYTDLWRPRENHTGDAMKYSLDVARQVGMRLEAWGSYPFDRSTISDIYKALTGTSVSLDVFDTDGYRAVSHADPNIARANAAIWLYQLRRWGDAYAQFESGQIPFGTEDTRGWLRHDVDVRHPTGEATKRAFREWLRARYGSVERMNAAWGTAFASFEAVDPEASGKVNQFGHRWEYRQKDQPFHDWNRAICDYDAFRTRMRIDNYSEALRLIREEVPQAAMILRTEGANAIVDGLDPRDPNPHLRHAYYSQRRVAALGGMIRRSGAFTYHSDYTTLPYTESELRKLTRMGVEQGVIPAWLPQFDNMRDIALNEKHGIDYQVNYNVDRPVKGVMMHVLTPVYPWFRAVIEEGGIPGILWEDLQCDGFVTETQQREMVLFKEKLQDYLESPEGQAAATRGVRRPDRSWLSKVTPKASYRLQ